MNQEQKPASNKIYMPPMILCGCPEPPATGEDWPDNMHTHEGCRVYHSFKDCAIGQGVLPLK